MPRPGDYWMHGLLHDLHAEGCDGAVNSECRPVVVPANFDREPTYEGQQQGAEIEVVYMEWCESCGAADYEVV